MLSRLKNLWAWSRYHPIKDGPALQVSFTPKKKEKRMATIVSMRDPLDIDLGEDENNEKIHPIQ